MRNKIPLCNASLSEIQTEIQQRYGNPKNPTHGISIVVTDKEISISGTEDNEILLAIAQYIGVCATRQDMFEVSEHRNSGTVYKLKKDAIENYRAENGE